MIKTVTLILVIASSFLYPQDDFNNRFMLANSFEQAGEYEKAKNILKDLYARQPNSYQVFEVLNRVYIQLKDYDASEKLISSRIAANPQDVNMYGLLGKTYHIKGEEQRAYETWDRAIQVSGNNLSFYRVIANYAIERRAFSKAIDVLNEAKEKTPDPVILSLDIANLYALTMNYTKAAEEYVFVLTKVPAEIVNVRSRMIGYISKPEALKPTIRVFEDAKNRNNEVKSILAWLYTEDKNFKEAYNLFSELDKARGSKGGDVYNYAQMLFSTKEYQAAAEVYNDIISSYGSSPFINASRMGYAKSMEEILYGRMKEKGTDWKPMKKGSEIFPEETDKLVSAYMDLAKQLNTGNPEFTNEALFRAARIFLYYKNQPDKASELYKIIVNNNPLSSFSPPSALDLGYISIKKGNTEEALSHLEKVAQFPRATDEHKNKSKMMMAEIFFYKKEFKDSQRILSEVTANLKDNSANDAIELSLLLNTKMNDSLGLISYADAEFLAAQEKFVEARDKYAEISQEKGGIMLGSLARLRVAETELAMDNTLKSIEILEEVSGKESRNIYSDKALYLLGNIYEFGLNNPEKALEIYQNLLARFPSSMYLDEAREQIIKIKNKLS